MSEPSSEPASQGGERPRTRAGTPRGRWPGLVWAVPLAALLIVGYLGLRAYAQRGVDVVVTFTTSGGARAGDTPVVYKGVTIGKVQKIEVGRNVNNVDMTLRLEGRVKNALREGAQFWMIGDQTNLLDPSTLKAVVSGVSIGASPGTGKPTRHFIGLEAPPAVPPGTPGRLFLLRSATIGAVPVGAGVYFHGTQVGHVTAAKIYNSHDFGLAVFVVAPFERLVHTTSVFYTTHPLQVDLSSKGLTATLGPGKSVLLGGVEFDNPDAVAEGPQAPAGRLFTLFATQADAMDQPVGPQIPYSATFHAAAGLPAVGAPVTFAGERIGRVLSRRLSLAVGAARPDIQVRLEVEPAKLNLSGGPAGGGGDSRAATDAALAGLVRGGYRIKLDQAPPLIGGQALVLAQASGSPAAAIRYGGGDPELPTAASADLGAITDKANSILAKVDQIPLTQIGANVREITGRLNQLVSSPQLTDSLNHLDGTLRQVDEIVHEVKPQVGPLITKLNAAAGELQGVAANANAVLGGSDGRQDATLPDAIHQITDTARSIRTLADYLGRHPEALLRGKSKGS